MVYQWTSMAEFFKLNPQVVGETMEKLEEEYGEVTKENFLDASRPEESPTHSLFEWNDSIAAEQYRLQQSQNVIRHIAVSVITSKDSEPKQVRAYVNVEKAGGTQEGRFVNVISAMSNIETRKIVLENAYRELQMFAKKYATYSELGCVFEAIEKFAMQMKQQG